MTTKATINALATFERAMLTAFNQAMKLSDYDPEFKKYMRAITQMKSDATHHLYTLSFNEVKYIKEEK